MILNVTHIKGNIELLSRLNVYEHAAAKLLTFLIFDLQRLAYMQKNQHEELVSNMVSDL